MSILPIIEILFLLATLLVPNNATEFTIKYIQGTQEKMTWTKQADGCWRATGDPKTEHGIWKASVTSVEKEVGDKKYSNDLSPFVSLPLNITWNTLPQLRVRGKGIKVIVEKNRIVLSQESDGLLEHPAEITWKTKTKDP